MDAGGRFVYTVSLFGVPPAGPGQFPRSAVAAFRIVDDPAHADLAPVNTSEPLLSGPPGCTAIICAPQGPYGLVILDDPRAAD